ncbi:MAG: hypothetical protein FVQ82_10475 [Planctomycetes bacterium]|nr:hypothetical protein [Planctomycetota bacterium]
MRKVIFFLFFVLLCGGCDIVGWIVNPGPYDIKVTAEFKIKSRANEKVMVFVDQISGADVGIPMREDIRDAICAFLINRAGVKRKYLVIESEANIIRNYGAGYRNYDAVKIASDLKAGLLLYTRILDYKLYPSAHKGYYTGSLDTASVIYDVSLKKVVWPADGKPRVVRMEVLTESRGEKETIEKLMTSTAHGIVRHLYNIKRPHFKTSLEKVTY